MTERPWQLEATSLVWREPPLQLVSPAGNLHGRGAIEADSAFSYLHSVSSIAAFSVHTCVCRHRAPSVAL